VKYVKSKSKIYDLIVSLGSSCQVAQQLKQNNLRSFSSPLDWFISNSTLKICELLHNQFNDLFLPENTIQCEQHNGCYIVKDNLYECFSYHDFRISDNPNGILLSSFCEFKNKLNRRILNLKQKVTDSNKLLFIRSNCSENDARILYEALKSFCGQKKDIDLMIVNYHYHKNVEMVDLDNNIRVCHIFNPADNWKGDDDCWKMVLSDIELNPYKNVIYKKENTDIFLQEQYVFFEKGFYDVEKYDFIYRWINSYAEMYLKCNATKCISFCLKSFFKKRQCTVKLNDRIVYRGYVSNNDESLIMITENIKDGVNKIEIISDDKPDKPCDIKYLNNDDNWELSFCISKFITQ